MVSVWPQMTYYAQLFSAFTHAQKMIVLELMARGDLRNLLLTFIPE